MDRDETYAKLSEMIQVDPVVLQRARYTDDELTALFNTVSKAFNASAIAEEALRTCANTEDVAHQTRVLIAQSILNRLAHSVNTRASFGVQPEQKVEPSLDDCSLRP